MASRTFTEEQIDTYYKNGDFLDIHFVKATRGTVHYTATIRADDNKYYHLEYAEDPEFGEIYPKHYTLPEVFPNFIISIREEYTYSPEPNVNVDVPQNMSEQKNMYIKLLQQALHQIQENQ